jgi:hypothetical protein
MGFLKKLRKTVKKIASPVTKITEKVLKPVVRPLRPVVSKAIPFIPMTAGPALFLKAKAFGIRSERGVAGYKRSQKVSRIGTAAAAVVGGAIVAAPAVAGAVSGIGLPSLGTVVSGAGGLLPMLGGGGGPTEDTAWNPEGEGGVPSSFFDFYRNQGGPMLTDSGPGPAAPSGRSPVLALVGLGVGVYLLTRGG